MTKSSNLNRFINAQEKVYSTAVTEIKSGCKTSHWMWFLFPQIAGLGLSEMSKRYAIHDMHEATQYLEHPLLGERLIELSTLVTQVKGKTVHQIFGSPDDMKLKSCMTLFACIENAHPVFQQVLDIYYNGQADKQTLQIIKLFR